MPENDIDLVNRGLLIENSFGWQDYNDLATKTTPITLTANTWTNLSNDGAGPYSQMSHKIFDHGNIWNTSTNSFNFSGLSIGDVILMRLSATITTYNSNINVGGKLRLAVGSAIEYDVPFFAGLIKSSGSHYITTTTMIYIGSTETRDYPGKVMALSDTSGTKVEVDGWFITSLCRT